ncbi:MAG: hypothetical protein ISS25_01730 [Nanoarchaeota archaeon]|nr:hypothetical protein [DPANN group archaeon]MBL7116529.1 hypothetical protein [Nanoarchaeota archaeon]
MLTRVIAATGEVELEQQVNVFIVGKNVVDIKLTEWVNYQHQTGGYSAFITYEDGPPTRQVQVKIFATTGETELEQQINAFIVGKTVVDIKFTEWAEYEAQTGGYTALVMYVAEPGTAPKQQVKQPVRPQSQPGTQSAPQFDAI